MDQEKVIKVIITVEETLTLLHGDGIDYIGRPIIITVTEDDDDKPPLG